MSKRLLPIFVFLFVCVFVFLKNNVFASTAYVRITNPSAGASVTGTACLTTTANATEDHVDIVFPSGWNISQTIGNWTTSTTNLPSGSTSWPSVGPTASSINGLRVRFSSGNLATNTQYCFNFTSIASTVGSTGNDKEGTITTKDANDTIIESIAFAISVMGANGNKISVTATVPAKEADFTTAISSSLTGGVTTKQNTQIDYTFSYGSNLSYAVPVTVKAQWYEGTIQGSSSTVDIADYVVGSASVGHANTSPVIDTVNKTITWTISSFPANTTKTGTFSLKTNSGYTGGSLVTLPVAIRLTSTGVTTVDKTVNASYQYNAPTATPTQTSTPTPTSGATSTPGPTTTPTSGPTATPTITLTPTPIPATFKITGVAVQTKTDSNASIAVSTNQKSAITLNYGTSISGLSASTQDNSQLFEHSLSLSGLSPATQYYFRLTATSINGSTITSETFTFTTANTSDFPTINSGSITIISGNTILASSQTPESQENNSKPTIVVPVDSPYQFQFSLSKYKTIKKVKVVLRKKQKVLGFFTAFAQDLSSANNTNAADQQDLNTVEVEVVEIHPGVFSGSLQSVSNPGDYELVAVISDTNGNIVEEKISQILIKNRFTVLTQDEIPIQGVRVLLYAYNNKTKQFYVPNKGQFGIRNPAFTDSSGQIPYVLPFGRYKAEITNLGYNDQKLEFTIGEGINDGYPIVHMNKAEITIDRTIRYYYRAIVDDFIYFTNIYLNNLKYSLRFFDTIGAFSIAAFFLLSGAIMVFLKRSHIPLLSLPKHLWFYVASLIHSNLNSLFISGIIRNEKNKSFVKNATVYLIKKDGDQVIDTTHTNAMGHFIFHRRQNTKELLLSIMKEGYEPISLSLMDVSNCAKLIIALPESKDIISKRFERYINLIDVILGLSFQTLLISSFLFEIMFLFSFGWLRTLPFLLISGFNLIVSFLYVDYRTKIKSQLETS